MRTPSQVGLLGSAPFLLSVRAHRARTGSSTGGHSERLGYFLEEVFRADTFFVDFGADFFALGAAFLKAAFFFVAGFLALPARTAFFAGAFVDDFELVTALDRLALAAGSLAGRLTVGEAAIGVVGNPIAA
jgi:hypothetical protein